MVRYHPTALGYPPRVCHFSVFALALALSAIPGCAVHPSRAPDDVPLDGRLITRGEIEATGMYTVWDILKKTTHLHLEETSDGRPADITHRGRGSITLADVPVLLVDGTRVFNIEILQSMRAEDVFSILVLSGPQATIRYGTNAHSGVIVITTIH